MMDGLLTPANTSTVETLEKVFVFCMIWAMGSSLTLSDDGTDYQKLFSEWWRSEWKKVRVSPHRIQSNYFSERQKQRGNIFLGELKVRLSFYFSFFSQFAAKSHSRVGYQG